MSKNNDITLNSSVLDIVSLLLKDGLLHVRELSRRTGLSPTTASSMLKGLEKRGILARKIIGRNYSYQLNKNSMARKIAIMAEEHRALKALCSDSQMRSITESALWNMSRIKGMVDFVFLSDMGLVFITQLDSETVKAEMGKVSLKGSGKIIVMTKENLRNNIRGDDIRNLLEGHIILYGAERFIETIYNR